MTTWTKASFTYSTWYGSHVPITGYTREAWGLDKRNSKVWVLTHLNTGYSAGSFKLLVSAKEFSDYLDSLPVAWARIENPESKAWKKHLKKIKTKRSKLGGFK